MTGLRYFSRRARLERAELRLADAEHYYKTWVRPFPGSSPSDVYHAKQRIEKAKLHVQKLRAHGRLGGET